MDEIDNPVADEEPFDVEEKAPASDGGDVALSGLSFYLKLFGKDSRPLYLLCQVILIHHVFNHLVFDIHQTKCKLARARDATVLKVGCSRNIVSRRQKRCIRIHPPPALTLTLTCDADRDNSDDPQRSYLAPMHHYLIYKFIIMDTAAVFCE